MVKVKVKGRVIRALLYWHENRFFRIIRIRGIIYYSRQVCNLLFLHFNAVRQVAARLRAKSAMYDFFVAVCRTLHMFCAGGVESETVDIGLCGQQNNNDM